MSFSDHVPNHTLPLSLKEKATALYTKHEYDAALKIFLDLAGVCQLDSASKEVRQQHVTALANATACLIKLSKWEDALSLCLDVLAVDPKQLKVLFRACEAALHCSPTRIQLDTLLQKLQTVCNSAENTADACDMARNFLTKLALLKLNTFGSPEGSAAAIALADPVSALRKHGFTAEYRAVSTDKSDSCANILIVLPGLGDTAANFIKFAEKCELKATALLAIQPIQSLPFGLGYSWYNAFDSEYNMVYDGKQVEDDLMKTCAKLGTALAAVCELFPGVRVHLLGYQQGANVALQLILSQLSHTKSIVPHVNIYSAFSIGGGIVGKPPDLPASYPDLSLMLVSPSDSDGIAAKQAQNATKYFSKCTFRRFKSVVWSGPAHLPQSRAESYDMMEFWSHALAVPTAFEGDTHSVRIT